MYGKCIRKNVQPDSSWKVYKVRLLTTSDSYQKALNYAKRKSNSDTETSCSQLGKSKRRRKHKSQDVSDNSDSDLQRMISPPSITISHDIRTDPYDELLHDKTASVLLSQELSQ